MGKEICETAPEVKEMEEKALVDALVTRVAAAQKEFANFSQEQVDRIFKAAALAANAMRIPLARMAVEETGMGVLEDKIIHIIYTCFVCFNIFVLFGHFSPSFSIFCHTIEHFAVAKCSVL